VLIAAIVTAKENLFWLIFVRIVAKSWTTLPLATDAERPIYPTTTTANIAATSFPPHDKCGFFINQSRTTLTGTNDTN
jgi:hypothetical protein